MEQKKDAGFLYDAAMNHGKGQSLGKLWIEDVLYGLFIFVFSLSDTL